MRLDKIDEKIINELSSDSKIGLRQLAQKLGVSFVTVRNRIKKLEDMKAIKQYTAKVDYEKLGYEVHIIIEVRIQRGKLIELEKRIANSPNVYALYDVTGDFDALVIAKFKSTKSMDAFLKKIQTYDFVERTNTILVLNTIKEGHIKLEE
jgi:Lrp/AsnC family transcriptional regulator, regulator for asnA, asnC and gidA